MGGEWGWNLSRRYWLVPLWYYPPISLFGGEWWNGERYGGRYVRASRDAVSGAEMKNNPSFPPFSPYQIGEGCWGIVISPRATSIFQTASMPSSSYSSTDTDLMQSWASRAAGPPIEPR